MLLVRSDQNESGVDRRLAGEGAETTLALPTVSCAFGAKVVWRVAIVASAALVIAALPGPSDVLLLLVRSDQNDSGVDRRLAGEGAETTLALPTVPRALGAPVPWRVTIVASAALGIAALPGPSDVLLLLVGSDVLLLLVRSDQNDSGVDRRLAGEGAETTLALPTVSCALGAPVPW